MRAPLTDNCAPDNGTAAPAPLSGPAINRGIIHALLDNSIPIIRAASLYSLEQGPAYRDIETFSLISI